MLFARDQAGDVRHVGDHRRPDALRDLADPREIDDARIRARADHDHLRFVFLCEARQLVVIDALIVLADAVRNDRVELAREIQRMAVREVSAVRQVHPQHRVARLEQREVHGHVRLCARVRLHVGVFRAEQRLRAFDRERLCDVDELAAAVVALARISFGVLVGEHRPCGFEDCAADEVLRCDELEAVVLPALFVAHGLSDVGIRVRKAERSCWSVCFQRHDVSISDIWSRRFWWRPPSNGVSSHSFRMSSASPNATMRPPIESTFASLCCRDSRAV